jgi:hypothetical protein
MNRKELQQEIEQLIHSIKLHYNHINEETRIPTIELELITAKIRKLHEKSILYNHLHYLEEHGLTVTRATAPPSVASKMVSSSTPSDHEVRLEASISVASEPAPPPPVDAPVVSVPEPAVVSAPQPLASASTEAPSRAQVSTGLDMNSFISFNDRYVFISKLFWGNADEYKRGIASINASANVQEAEAVALELGNRFKWDADNEAVKLFQTILQRMFSR